MKRRLLSLLLCLSLAFAFSVPAFAANYEDAAETLKSFDLFRGTDNGFELDRPASRIEAAVMLVRLLGLEDDANARYAAKETSHPFTDVPAWADAYIALLYTDGLAKGSGATIFGTSDCTAQMYCNFLLRALGYTEAAGDFTYDKALNKAISLGFYDAVYFDGLLGNAGFLRDEVVALSYLALAVNVKGTEKTLLAKLVDDGVVDAKTAETLLALQKTLRESDVLTAAVNGKYFLPFDMDIKLNLTLSGTENLPVGGDVKALADLSKDDPRMSFTCKLTNSGNAANVQVWYKDGWFYAQTDDAKVKTSCNLGGTLFLTSLVANAASNDALSTLFVKELTKNSTGSYDLALSDAICAPLYDIPAPFFPFVEDVHIIDLQLSNLTLRCDKNGTPQKVGFDLSLSLTAKGESVKADASVSANVYPEDKTVTISFPSDLSAFREVNAAF